MRRIVGTFVAASLAAALVFLALSTWLSQRAARNESIDDARRSTDLFARIAIAPALQDGLVTVIRRPSRTWTRRYARPLTPSSGVVRVKIWSPQGRIALLRRAPTDRAHLPRSTPRRSRPSAGDGPSRR